MAAALVLFSLTVYFMGPLTRSLVDSFWLGPGVTETIGLLPWADADKSSIVQHEAMALPDILPVFGSSELRSGHGFAPGVVFMDKPTGFATFYMGGAWFQCLPHLIELAGQKDLTNRKLVVLLPTDWFFNGLSAPNFARNFSPLDVYQMLFSPGLPAPLRQAVVKRILQYSQVADKDRVLDLFLKSYINGNGDWQTDLVHLALWPVARLDFASLQLQDCLVTIKDIRKVNPKIIAGNSRAGLVIHQIPWSDLRSRAIQQGKSAITNNYGVDNGFLPKVVTPETMDSQRKTQMDKSPEYQDLTLLLRVLKAKGARPLFIILPFNGPYRDFTGLPVSQRQEHYRRLRQLISHYGYPFVDLSSQEYQPYYFNDTIHLSGRAWVDIDEILDDFYHNQLVLVNHVPTFISAAPGPNVDKSPAVPETPQPYEKPRPVPPPSPNGRPQTGPPHGGVNNPTEASRKVKV